MPAVKPFLRAEVVSKPGAALEVTRIVLRPTHWADDRGYVVTDEWLQSPKATSDYRAAYNSPGRMVRGKFKPLDPINSASQGAEQ